jgi:phytol kinase
LTQIALPPYTFSFCKRVLIEYSNQEHVVASKLSQEYDLSTKLSAIVKEIRQFVSNIQRPKLNDRSWVTSTCQYSKQLEARIAELQKPLIARHESFRHSLDEFTVSLRAYCTGLTENTNNKKLNALYASLTRSYEDFLAQLPKLKLEGVVSLIRTSHLKPMNYSRNLFHALSGIAAVLLYQFFLTKPQAAACALVAAAVLVSLEVIRRYSSGWNKFLSEKIFRVLAHPSERHRITGSTYFLVALAIITVLFPKPSVEVAVLILSLADPAASITGRLWGERKLYHNKSYVGTGSFFAVAWISAIIFLTVAVKDLSTPHAVVAALIIAIAGTIVEVLSTRLDDNLTVPVVCALTAFLLL